MGPSAFCAIRAWPEQVKCHELNQYVVGILKWEPLQMAEKVAAWPEIPAYPFPVARKPIRPFFDSVFAIPMSTRRSGRRMPRGRSNGEPAAPREDNLAAQSAHAIGRHVSAAVKRGGDSCWCIRIVRSTRTATLRAQRAASRKGGTTTLRRQNCALRMRPARDGVATAAGSLRTGVRAPAEANRSYNSTIPCCSIVCRVVRRCRFSGSCSSCRHGS